MNKGTELHPPKWDVQVFTDASDTGWGAHCLGEEIQGDWSPLELSLHINVQEMKVIFIALKNFSALLKGKVVMFLCDNSTTVWHLRKAGGVKVWQLYALTWLIYSKANKMGITIQIRHIPGALNVIADRLSRKGQIQQTEWSLHPHVFKRICSTLYKPMIDGFATADNTKLPLYISPVPDPAAYSVDALSVPWTGLCLYLFPPVRILSQVLRKLLLEPCRALVIAPFWPSQIWFWDIVHASTNQPMALPDFIRLLRQPGKPPVFDTHFRMRNLHVWQIDTTRAVNPQFIDSPWLRDFTERKRSPPAVFCSAANVSGSFTERVAFWLKTGTITM